MLHLVILSPSNHCFIVNLFWCSFSLHELFLWFLEICAFVCVRRKFKVILLPFYCNCFRNLLPSWPREPDSPGYVAWPLRLISCDCEGNHWFGDRTAHVDDVWWDSWQLPLTGGTHKSFRQVLGSITLWRVRHRAGVISRPHWTICFSLRYLASQIAEGSEYFEALSFVPVSQNTLTSYVFDQSFVAFHSSLHEVVVWLNERYVIQLRNDTIMWRGSETCCSYMLVWGDVYFGDSFKSSLLHAHLPGEIAMPSTWWQSLLTDTSVQTRQGMAEIPYTFVSLKIVNIGIRN